MLISVNDTLTMEVPYMKGWEFPEGTVLRILPTPECMCPPTFPENAVISVRIEEVPMPARTADRPIQAVGYRDDNGYQRVSIDMSLADADNLHYETVDRGLSDALNELVQR
jgi:hypothetical protein